MRPLAFPRVELLRFALRATADELGATTLFVAWADGDALDTRTGRALYGGVYLAAGFIFAGESEQRRVVCFDATGTCHSTRQGPVTITRRSAAARGWSWVTTTTPLRTWLTVVAPDTALQSDGVRTATSRRWQKRERRRCWHAVRRPIVGARWMEYTAWRRLSRHTSAHVQMRRLRWPQILIGAVWNPRDWVHSFRPLWDAGLVAQSQLSEHQALEERTAGRSYRLAPGLRAAAS